MAMKFALPQPPDRRDADLAILLEPLYWPTLTGRVSSPWGLDGSERLVKLERYEKQVRRLLGVISHDDLDGVAKGDEAAMMLLEYMRAATKPPRRAEIRRQLLQYCELDTWATVEVLRVLREHCGLSA